MSALSDLGSKERRMSWILVMGAAVLAIFLVIGVAQEADTDLLEEIRERIRNLYCRKLARNADSPLEAVQMYHALLKLMQTSNERAFVWKKIAESYHEAGYPSAARDALGEALHLQPKMKGTQKIRQKLGL